MDERHDLLAQVGANKRRTVYIMAGFTLFVGAVVAAFDLAFAGGPVLIAIAIVVALAMVWTGYYYSDRLAIAAAHGVEAGPAEYPQLHNLVEGLCLGVGLPKPRIYIVNDPAPNAFATGRNPDHVAVAVTTGLLSMMNRTELEGPTHHSNPASPRFARPPALAPPHVWRSTAFEILSNMRRRSGRTCCA
jgi:heat shock protein HtpX